MQRFVDKHGSVSYTCQTCRRVSYINSCGHCVQHTQQQKRIEDARRNIAQSTANSFQHAQRLDAFMRDAEDRIARRKAAEALLLLKNSRK